MSDDWRPRPAPDPPTERIPRGEPSQVIRRDPGRPPPPPRRQSPPPPLRQPPPPPPRRPPPPPPRRPPPPPTARPAIPPSGTPPRTKRKRRWGRRLFVTLLLVVLAAAAGLAGGAVWIDSSLHRVAVFDYTDRPAAGAGTTWLLVGSDSRAGLTPEQQAELTTGGDLGNGRTDTILVVHIPALGSSGPTTMVSIPRDSYVDIPGYGMDKINAAFALGGGPLLAQTVEEATGLRLDHYAEVGFDGFAVVVDALGGVQVCPAAPIDDPLAGINLPAGCQTLDGRAALGYVRSRATPRADLDRMVHQREFMAAVMHRATSPVVWVNPWRWYAVPHAAVESLTVDNADHVWDLAALGWALHGSTTEITVPIGEFTSSDSGSVVVWDSDAADQLFHALRTDSAIPQQVLDAQP
ncbi:LCP family protein [Mycobacterium sp. CVI_P3]|uniref:LCP family protein n=1 Tax=Mycobacterium pinniadriaticum TaxID=2994102 RepID=A0ABT3SK41_9MYCO|nr:LCP family protein [Mycobacterium pinniadriaticum]MCX2933476.1 LCP family protein [Mycobacterium pinniadriaticum]MCX2939885.1 LCP family protein [Mycobacterium pinniadriaticum]